MAQQKPTDTKVFQGAVSVNKQYKAVYQLNTNDDKKISSTFKNITNALEDPRLAGKLKSRKKEDAAAAKACQPWLER